jgi:hypothetical protein
MNLFFIQHIFHRRSILWSERNIHWTPSVCSVQPIHPPNGMAFIYFSDRTFLIYPHVVATHPRPLYHQSTLLLKPNPRNRCSQVEVSGALWCQRRYNRYNGRRRHDCQCYWRHGESGSQCPHGTLMVDLPPNDRLTTQAADHHLTSQGRTCHFQVLGNKNSVSILTVLAHCSNWTLLVYTNFPNSKLFTAIAYNSPLNGVMQRIEWCSIENLPSPQSSSISLVGVLSSTQAHY